jgi:thiol-disulfide isomerase/thioredoxin
MDALIGHPVVISYWATWCIPCQQELPILQKLYEEYAGSGLVVLTVNAIDQDSLDKVQAMLAEKGMTLPVLLDQGSAFANDYQAMFFPTTYYIDPAGVIRFIKLGDSTEADLREHVDSLMRGEL